MGRDFSAGQSGPRSPAVREGDRRCRRDAARPAAGREYGFLSFDHEVEQSGGSSRLFFFPRDEGPAAPGMEVIQ